MTGKEAMEQVAYRLGLMTGMMVELAEQLSRIEAKLEAMDAPRLKEEASERYEEEAEEFYRNRRP